MGRRIWYMGRSATASTESALDAAATAEGLRDGLIAAEGVDPSLLAAAQSFDRRRGFDRSPTHHAGVAGTAAIKGERYEMLDEHVNASGERVTEVVRKNESGRWETRHIVESRAGEHTFVISEVR